MLNPWSEQKTGYKGVADVNPGPKNVYIPVVLYLFAPITGGACIQLFSIPVWG